jgi:hypothetical protein
MSHRPHAQLLITSAELQGQLGQKYVDESELAALLLCRGLVRRDNTYAKNGGYKKYKAPPANDDIFRECGGAVGGGIPLTWHERQHRFFDPRLYVLGMQPR